MFRVIFQVSCMIVLASVFYDVLSCNRFCKTQTYKYIKYVGTSKYGKILLKKWKRARRICFKSLEWVSCSTPTDNSVTVNNVEPYAHCANWSMDLNKNIMSLIHYVLAYFGEKISFQHPILSCDGLITIAKVVAAGAYQQIQKCKQTTTEYITKIMPLR